MPVEARLIGRVDARSLVGILRLVAEGVRKPSLAVVRTLKLDFVAAASHDGEEAVAVRDSKGLEGGYWRGWEGRAGPDHPEEENGAGVEEAREDYGGERDFHYGEVVGESVLPREPGLQRGHLVSFRSGGVKDRRRVEGGLLVCDTGYLLRLLEEARFPA